MKCYFGIFYNKIECLIICILSTVVFTSYAQNKTLEYNIEVGATISNGNYSPLWLNANRYGLYTMGKNSEYFRTGIEYDHIYKYGWSVSAILDIVSAYNMINKFWIQQANIDILWKNINLSIGSKERLGFPFEKNFILSSGWMTEGTNARPIPQVRVSINDFLSIPWLCNWLAFKGHLAYGVFMDGKWQEEYVGYNKYFTKGAKYHSKSLLFRFGNIEKLPLEFEFGLIMATQFGGSRYLKNSQGEILKIMDMPDDIGAYWSAFFPQPGGSDTIFGEQMNVEGNMLGSWNFALNYYLNKWKLRIHLDHYFEDHSQLFWEYGRWKDGQIGVEITPPKNQWISALLWEIFSTYDQTGPILYEDRWGSFSGMQTSGSDNYYNHGIYNAWQHYGMAIGNPILLGPIYNENKKIYFNSSRAKAQHFGLCGNPSNEWSWRIKTTFARYWGTYSVPLDQVRKQIYTAIEFSYMPKWIDGLSISLSGALDRGNYLGDSIGGMIVIKKYGSIL